MTFNSSFAPIAEVDETKLVRIPTSNDVTANDIMRRIKWNLGEIDDEEFEK